MVALDELSAIEALVGRCKIPTDLITTVWTFSTGGHFQSSETPQRSAAFRGLETVLVTRRNLSPAKNYRI